VAKDETSEAAPRAAKIAAATATGVFFGIILAFIVYAIVAG
jgi:hypothetical protein